MKILFASILCFIWTSSLQAKVITVDNNEGAGADYATISSAISNAVNGDSIYVHPSYTDYGNFSVNKQVYLIGPGHYPASSGYLSARILKITLQNGSSGCLISGFQINQIDVQLFHVAHNITIENNYFALYGNIYGPYGSGSDGDGWVIRGNIFVEAVGCGGCKIIEARASGNDNWLIANNIFISKNSQNNTQIFSNLNATSTVINNTVIHRNTADIFQNTSNAHIKNNIIVSLTASLTDIATGCANCQWENNTTFNPVMALDALQGTNNNDNTDPEFVDAPTFEWHYNYDFNVLETSPIHNSGSDGTDPGAYGASFNFSKFGFPFGVPVIEAFFIENQLINKGEILRFTIKARSADSAAK